MKTEKRARKDDAFKQCSYLGKIFHIRSFFLNLVQVYDTNASNKRAITIPRIRHVDVTAATFLEDIILFTVSITT